jgi:hypothetical protein
MAKVKKEKELLVRLNSNYDCQFDYPKSGFLEDIDFSEFKNTLIDRVIQQLKLFVIISFLEIEVGRRYCGITGTFTLQVGEIDFSRIKMNINYDYDDYDNRTVYFIEPYYLLKGDEVTKYKKVVNQITVAQSKRRQDSEREQYLKLKKKFENE